MVSQQSGRAALGRQAVRRLGSLEQGRCRRPSWSRHAYTRTIERLSKQSLRVRRLGRQAVLGLSRKYDFEPQLRLAQEFFAEAGVRRNRRDDANLKLLLRLSLRETDSCIDIGANIGDILAAMVDGAPAGQHIAYEPLPTLAAELAERFPNVDVRQAALAASPGRRSFVRVVDADSRSGFAPPVEAGTRTETFEVNVESLDTSLPSGFRPAAIKIDVEQAEMEVLEGAMGVITEHRPLVAIEHGGPTSASRRLYALLVEEAGLRAFDLDGCALDSDRFLDRVRTGSHWNFVFRP